MEEIARLRQAVEVETATAAALERSLAETRTEADSLSARLDDTEARRAEGDDEIARLRQALEKETETAASRIGELDRTLGAAEARATALAARLEEAERQREAGEEEIAGLERTLADDAEAARTSIADLERALAAAKDRIAALSARIGDMEIARLARQQTIDALTKALAAAEAKAVALAESLEDAEAGQAAGREEVRRLESAAAELAETANEKLVALQKALADARAQAAARGRLVETAEAERDAQLAEAARLREALAAAEAQAASLAERLAAAENERDAQRREVARLETALAAAVGEREAGQRVGEGRLQEALAEAARLRDQLALTRNRLAEAREELQLRRGVAASGEARAADTVERSLFEAAEARVMQLAVENTRLRDQLADLDVIERDSEDRIAELRRRIDEQIAEIEKLEALRRALAAAREKLEAEKAEQVDRLAYLRSRAEKAEAESRLAKDQIARLASNIRALKEQVRRLNEALEASEAKAEAAETLVLDARLNSALVRKIDELRRFRSEFVGQLREALAGQQLVQTEDDRFYLPAEVLFLSGSADLDKPGRERVRRIGRALTDVAARIPEDLDWVLRVDGHTDRQRLRDRSRYKTNWELSVARAIAVVRAACRDRRAGRAACRHRVRRIPSPGPGPYPGGLPAQPAHRVFADAEVSRLRRPIAEASGAHPACGRRRASIPAG